MGQKDQRQVEEELMFYRKKVSLLEEIISQSNGQKAKMAQLISELITKDKTDH